jgi:hypothetical protein
MFSEEYALCWPQHFPPLALYSYDWAQLKVTLRRHLNTKSFCSVYEFLLSENDS